MPPRLRCGATAACLTVLLWGLIMAGCSATRPEIDAPSAVQQLQMQITRLEQRLAEKEREINRLRAQQQGRAKELQQSASEAAQAEVKLRRFATEADVVSRLAEVEVALETLQSRLGKDRQAPLQSTAQGLLDAASSAFDRGELSEAAELAAQARQLIDMLSENLAAANLQSAPEVPFKITIPLRTKTDTRLRRQPDPNAAVLDVLQRTTPVIVRAYRGPWLQVQTEAGDSGWVLGELLEPR